ncbi:MAG: hypothetical protein HFI31_11925 [Lachnospiraceae bacterium]|nr:hypothetical protein [Lachnospiraceae bacterium]
MNNITNILRQASYTAIAAVGMTMVIVIGEIDLSAGSLVCASGLVRAVVCKHTGNVAQAVLAVVLTGLAVGFVNGVLCAYGKLPGFIATLASMAILWGLADASRRGKVFGTIVGVLPLTVLTNGMTLVGMNTYWQQVLKGVIVVISVLADTRGKKGK